MQYLAPASTQEVEEAAKLFYQHIWKLHGLPDNLTSDWKSQFVSEFWKLICRRLRIDAWISTAYHPKTNDQTERVNAVMEHYLQAFVNYIQDDRTK